MVVRASDVLLLKTRSLNRGLFVVKTLRHRRVDCSIASMRQSGTHWLQYMLGLALAKLYDLPPPSHIKDKSIVGHPKSPAIYTQVPQIIYTHDYPHYFLRSRTLFRLFHFPKYLILVRDIRDALVAHYEKEKNEYNVDFSTFLRGDVRGNKYRYDIWMRILFLNAWGAVVKRHPERIAILRYEDLLADTPGQLARVCDHFNITGVTPELMDDVVAAASKEEMVKLTGSNPHRRIVRNDPRSSGEWYTNEDLGFVTEVCRRNLNYTFGYKYG